MGTFILILVLLVILAFAILMISSKIKQSKLNGRIDELETAVLDKTVEGIKKDVEDIRKYDHDNMTKANSMQQEIKQKTSEATADVEKAIDDIDEELKDDIADGLEDSGWVKK